MSTPTEAMTTTPTEAMPESPRHWPIALWRVKRKRQEELGEDENKTEVPSDLTSPTSPAERPATKSPEPTIDEAAEEEPGEEDLLSDSEIAKTLLQLQEKKKEDSPNIFLSRIKKTIVYQLLKKNFLCLLCFIFYFGKGKHFSVMTDI